MYCRKCGAENPDATVHCVNCGERLYDPDAGKGFAIASLVFGIVSFFLVPLLTGLLGIVFGGIAMSRGYGGKMAAVGLVLSFVGILSWLLILIF